MTTHPVDLTRLHVASVGPGRFILARQDAQDPRRWYAPAGDLWATGRLAELPGLGVQVYRTRKAAQGLLDGDRP